MQAQTNVEDAIRSDEEILDILISISVIAKRLATKLRNSIEEEKAHVKNEQLNSNS